jgi:hypothetical protein
MLTETQKEKLRTALRNRTLEVRSVDVETGELRWSAIEDVVRHETPHKEILRVVDVQGREVSCTEDHSLFQYDEEDGLTEMMPKHMKKGFPLAVCSEGSFCGSSPVALVERGLFRVYTYDLCVPGDENFVLSNGIVAHNTYSIGGVSLDLERSSKYESLKQNAEQQFEKMMTDGKQRTVKHMRGLRQSRYGMGVRSSFGPITGAGALTPRKFMGI